MNLWERACRSLPGQSRRRSDMAASTPPLTPGRLWWLLRRDLSRGLAASWGERVTLGRIWDRWRNPHAGQAPAPVPVHLLCGSAQIGMCAWMLASWIHSTGRNWKIVLHDDGSLSTEDSRRLAGLGLDVTTITRSDADRLMTDRLRPFPRCKQYRDKHPLALKLFDTAVMCEHPRFILLDSDLAFFARPAEILSWTDAPTDSSCWFNADAAESSNVPAAEAESAFDVALWPKVNSGLCLLDRAALDLAFCEDVLSRSTILDGHVWRIEQTLFALCASKAGRGGLLPASYEVSLGKHAAPGCVARHYVGAVRDRYYAEALPRIARMLRTNPEC